MSPNAHCSGTLERFVTVVAWLIDDLDQRWGDAILSRRIYAMAGRVFGVKAKLPDLSALSALRQIFW